jgi:hypothetical protein
MGPAHGFSSMVLVDAPTQNLPEIFLGIDDKTSR